MRIIRLPKKATRRGDMIHRLWFAPDDQQLVVLLGHEEGANVLCWLDLAQETIIDQLYVGGGDEHDCASPSPQFSPDHQYLAVPTEDSVSGEMTVLDRSAPKPTQVVLEGPRGAVVYEQYGCVTFTPDGAFLIAARSTTTPGRPWLIHRWAMAAALNAHQERLRPVPDTELRLHSSNGGPVSLAISPDGKFLATITYDGALIVVWEFASGELIAEMELPSEGDDREVLCPQRLLFSPDGRTLAAAGSVLAVFDVPSGELRHQLSTDKNVAGMAFDPAGQRLATVADSDEITLWDVVTGREAQRRRLEAESLRAIAIAADGVTAIAGGEGGRLIQWELTAQQEA